MVQQEDTYGKARTDVMPRPQLLGHLLTSIREVEARFQELDALLRSGYIKPEHVREIFERSEALKSTRICLLRTQIELYGLKGIDPYWRLECRSTTLKSRLLSYVSQLWLRASSVFCKLVK